MKFTLLIIFCSLFIFAKEIDPTTGLIKDKGLSDIKENCTICHTGRFIVLNGGDREFWKKKIKLMHDGYGLWDLTKEQKERILNYLVKNYPKKHDVSVNE